MKLELHLACGVQRTCAFHLTVLASRTLAAAGPYCRNPLTRSCVFRMVDKLREIYLQPTNREPPHTLPRTIPSSHLAPRILPDPLVSLHPFIYITDY